MKNIFFAILMGIGVPRAVWAEPAAVAASTDSFFIKAGGGSYLSRWYFVNHYNQPDENGIPSEVDWIYGLGGTVGSVAFGVDCPDHFSYFASGEWLADDGAGMLNLQYTFLSSNPVRPYIYAGLGFDLGNDNAIGGCGQLGLGVKFPLTRSFKLFLETKFFAALGLWSTSAHSIEDFKQWDLYIPVLAGIQINL